MATQLQKKAVHLEDNIQSNLESDLALEMLRVVEAAAIASAREMGTGDRKKRRSGRDRNHAPRDGHGPDARHHRDRRRRARRGSDALHRREGWTRAERRHDLSGSGHRGRPAGGHQPLRHRRAGIDLRAGRQRTRRTAARSGLLHGKDCRRPGLQGIRGPGCAHGGEPEDDRQGSAIATSRTWW